MNDVLWGLLGLVGYVAGVLAFSAAVTFAVVKLYPHREKKRKPRRTIWDMLPQPPESVGTTSTAKSASGSEPAGDVRVESVELEDESERSLAETSTADGEEKPRPKPKRRKKHGRR